MLNLRGGIEWKEFFVKKSKTGLKFVESSFNGVV